MQFVAAMAINCMLFLYYQRLTFDLQFHPFKTEGERVTFFWLARIMAILSFIGVVSNTLLRGWLAVDIGFLSNPTNEFSFRKQSMLQYLLCRLLYGSFVFRFIIVNMETLSNGDVTVEIGAAVMALYYYFTNASTMYSWALLTFSLLGWFVEPLFFVACMIEVLRVSDLMRYVTRSFTENLDQVVAAVVLGAVIIYVFVAVNVTYGRLDHDFNGRVGCDTLNQCTRLHFDYGVLNPPEFDDPGQIQHVTAELFNFAYVFIVNIVLPGIVSGIIIDTFSELRAQKMSIYSDVVNNCFICGLKREQFEAESVDFAEHTKNDHNMWKYLWYQEYLRDKEVSDFTGGEQFVAEMLKNADTRYKWLPLKKARVLQKVADRYDMFSVFKKLESLSERVGKMDEDLQAHFTAVNQSRNKSNEDDED